MGQSVSRGNAVTRLHTALAMLLCAGTSITSAVACERGSVFDDVDGDGRRAASESALPGVRVSDGRRIAISDGHGRWQLAGGVDAPVYVIKPAGYAVPMGADGLPRFWHRPQARECDFALRRDRRGTGLKVIVSSDPQAGTAREVAYYAAVAARGFGAHPDAALGLTLGDIANDDLSLYPALIDATVSAAAGVPWLHAPGNHDLEADAADDASSLATFATHFGPDTFAWEEREAVFVVLDNVVAQPGQRPAYVGGLREDQFAFLERYLAGLDPDRLLVVAAHIPWFDTAAPGAPPSLRLPDRERLFALLRPFPKLLLLSGHRHTQRRVFHDARSGWHGAEPLHEYNVGAMSGAYWSGVPAADGIPDATMADGTPRGFATLLVDEAGGYRLAWHPTSLPQDDRALTGAMALHAPKLLRRGAYPAWGVYANVYLGHAGTKVEYRVDGGDWQPMRHWPAPDPRLLVENVRDDLADALRAFDRSPEAEPSTHLWRGALSTRLAAGAHEVEVRAFDDQGGEHRARIGYRLVEAE
jgi:hypothetical protein